jgi:hypothetical protein
MKDGLLALIGFMGSMPRGEPKYLRGTRNPPFDNPAAVVRIYLSRLRIIDDSC